LCKWLRCGNEMSLPAETSSRALLLQQRWNESVLENIQRLIQIRASVFSCDTRAETDPILRDSRVVHGRNPKTAAPQLMTKPVHQLAITDHDRHYVSRRSSSVESELVELSVKVIGVLPKFRAQFELARPEFQRFENCRDDNRRQRTRIDIWMGIKTKVLQRLLRAGHETAQRAKRF